MAGPIRITVDVASSAARREIDWLQTSLKSIGSVRTSPKVDTKGISRQSTAVRNTRGQYTALGAEGKSALDKLNANTEKLTKVTEKSTKTSKKGFKSVNKTVDSTARSLKRAALAGAAIAVIGRTASAAGTYLKQAVTDASDMNETVSKTQAIFKGASGDIIKFAEGADRSLGLSKSAALDAAASFADMYLQLGISQGEATKLSKSTLQLAGDIGSFSNIDTADVLDRLAGAYRGEYDALQKVVPNINAARVETEALALTHKKSAKELTAADKALAVNAIVTKDSARAQGDFARTGDNLAGATKTIKAQFANLSATVGTAFLPGINSAALILRDRLVPAIEQVVGYAAPRINKALKDIAVGGLNTSHDTTQLVHSLKIIGSSLIRVADAGGTGFADSLTVIGVAMQFFAGNAELLSKLMPYLVAGLLLYKTAVLAANVAQLANVPLKLLEIATNRALIKSNERLAASRGAEVAATVTATTAESTSVLAKGRNLIVTTALKTATLAWAAVTRTAAAAQLAFNLVLAANPVGLVIAALAALVAVIVLAYRKSETFRAIVQGVFGFLRNGVVGVLGFVKENWPTILKLLTGPIGLVMLFADTKFRKKFVDVFKKIKDAVAGVFSGIGHGIVDALKGMINDVIRLANLPIKAINLVAGKIPGGKTVPEIPMLAAGGIVRRPTFVMAGEAGPEAIVPLDGRFGGGDTIHITVNAGVGDPAEIGRQTVNAIRSYERRMGRSVMSNVA